MTVTKMLYEQMLSVRNASGIDAIECECAKADAMCKTAKQILDIETFNMKKAEMLDVMGAKPSIIMPLLGATKAETDD